MEKLRFQPVQELDLSDYIKLRAELKSLNGLFSKLLFIDFQEKYLSKALCKI